MIGAGDEFDMNDMSKWTPPDHVQEIDPEAEAAFYKIAPPPKCHMCWNVVSLCACAVAASRALHPSFDPSVAGFHHADRDQLLHQWADRGITELERLANGGE